MELRLRDEAEKKAERSRKEQKRLEKQLAEMQQVTAML
jgi:hypothetical protein